MSNIPNRTLTYTLHCLIKQGTTEKPSKPAKAVEGGAGSHVNRNAVVSKQSTYLV